MWMMMTTTEIVPKERYITKCRIFVVVVDVNIYICHAFLALTLLSFLRSHCCIFIFLSLVSNINLIQPFQSRQRHSVDDDSRDAASNNVADDSDDELSSVKPQPLSLRPSEVLRSSTFYWLFIALFCCSFYGNLFYNLYKVLYYPDVMLFIAEYFRHLVKHLLMMICFSRWHLALEPLQMRQLELDGVC